MIRSRVFAIAFAGLTAAFAGGSPSASAAAQCQKWDVNSRWWIQQSGYTFGYFDIQQEGNLLQGRGRAESLSNPGMNGGLDGTINGSSNEITVYWHSEVVGVYRSTIGPTGRIEGTTFDKRHPKKRAAWYTTNKVSCLARVESLPLQPQPPEKKTTKVLGKKKIDPISSQAGEKSSGCTQGFVWRVAKPDDLVCVTPEARACTAEENQRAAARRDPNGAYGPHSYVGGYVWREAFERDTVCVTPETRTLVREENRLAASRRVGG